jgi:DNA-binding FadR family transcriptional regulator
MVEEPLFEPLRVLPAYRQLTDAILGKILNGSLPAGSVLPTETELCDQFGCNRSTVREGVRVLEQTGYLRREGGKRLFVSRPSPKDVGDHVERSLILHQVSFHELWEAAMVLEPPMAALAARNMTETDRLAIGRNLARTETALDDPGSLVGLDLEFHSLIANATKNRALQISHESLRRLFYPAYHVVLRQLGTAGERLLRAHREIFKAMCDQDFEAASQWMARHQRDFKRGFDMLGIDIDQPVTPSM